jgi:hypothetical protein
MTVWIYDQGEDLKVFATEEIAQAWIDENDPDGERSSTRSLARRRERGRLG